MRGNIRLSSGRAGCCCSSFTDSSFHISRPWPPRMPRPRAGDHASDLMPLHQLILLLALHPPPSNLHPTPHASPTLPSSLPQHQHPAVQPPQARPDHARQDKAGRCQHDPVSAHPEDEPCIFAVPAAPLVVAEEAPRVPVVLVRHEHPHSAAAESVADVLARGHEFLPHDGEEQGTGGVHDGDVGQLPVFIVGF